MSDFETEHTYTLSAAIKRKVDSQGRKLKCVLTHGWTELALGGRSGGRKVEMLHFLNTREAEAYAAKRNWKRR